MSYRIVRYTPDRRDGVIELQTHLWDPDRAVNDAYLAWKYERNPYLEAPFIHLALCGERVVGMRGLHGARWEAGRPAETFVGPCAGDLVVAPEHRNRGLVAAILEAAAHDLAASGYPYAFSLSAGLATQLASLTTGWRSLGAVETATRRSESPAASADAGGADRPAVGERLTAGGRAGDDAELGRDAGGHVSLDLAPRPEQMAELVDRIGGDGRLRQVRDAEFFAWRYRNPLSAYRFLFWEDARLEGYLVVQTPARRARRPATIVDWEAAHARARAELLRAAICWGPFKRLMIWSATLPPEAKAILRAAGFQAADPPGTIGHARRERISREAILVMAACRDVPASDWTVAGRRLLDPADWDVRAIYSDNF